MPDIAQPKPASQPRARGDLRITSRERDGSSYIDRLDQAGALKALFPGVRGRLDAICVNTAGGVTGGDRFAVTAEAGPGSVFCLTTQAAERAYRATGPDPGRVTTRLSAAAGATLFWLPQELILYDRCNLERSLEIDLAPDARLLMVEPVLFGRRAMGEVLRSARFSDRVAIRRDGRPAYLDGLDLSGDVAAALDRAAAGAGSVAMASLVHVAPDAEAHLPALRALMPTTGGASLLAPDMLAMRLVAEDGHALRQALLPVLDRLTSDGLPISWRL